ncbi:uncharacterized protein LOC107035476 isoform X2 [Diachasma alloeum]|uniref:uncharacterized protein LOC107035476 isoform X2 n=1 Tax=Diachasma alloeum TaxID=454923 RepID=UPI0007384436|nr:uncharacterized protein LOC107035476 isoform X2 [Diachasma alloeum]
MPDSEAVYQPTTVGYTYETGGDSHEVGGGSGLRNGFSRIMFRHKVSTRKWLEWVLLSVALCATVAGFTTLVVNLVASDGVPVPNNSTQADSKPQSDSNGGTKVEDKAPEDPSRGSLAVGACITLLGVSMGALWIWMRFFRRGGKSQRGGVSRASGQYGPVLTEVPSQMTVKQIVNDNRAVPLSDQEEETYTLMEDASGNFKRTDNAQENNINNQNTG